MATSRNPRLRTQLATIGLSLTIAVSSVAVLSAPSVASASVAPTALPSADGTLRRYIISADSATSAFDIAFEVRNAGGTVSDVYTDAITGLAARISDDQVAALRADSRVTAIEIDEIVELETTAVTDDDSGDVPVAGDIIPGRYIIRIKSTTPPAARDSIATILGTGVVYSYTHVFPGYAAELSALQVKELKANPYVVNIEPDRVVTAQADQVNPPWGLDRIDQTNLPLNGHYVDRGSGAGVNVYVVDSGIASHSDFANRLVAGRNFVSTGTGGNTSTTDCNGHGTHVAGTIAGTTYGVAKSATLVPVRVLDCSGSGSNSGVINGLNWIVGNHAVNVPAVANLSLGGSKSDTLNAAVQSVINDGVIVVVAAGNNALDACNYSPASAAQAITIGASTSTDTVATFSNTGTCLDMFAPGQGIQSTWLSGTTRTLDGTSMASPHVAGAAAVLWSENTSATATAVTTNLLGRTSNGKLTSIGTNSPNKILYLAPVGGTPPGAPTGLAVTAGVGSATATWNSPTQTGSSAISSYTVTATPGNATCTWSTGPLTCTINGLAPGSYSFSVSAANEAGPGVSSTSIGPVTVAGTNDFFAYARTITTTGSTLTGTLTDSNTTATVEANEPTITNVGAGGGSTLWYAYTASATGPLTVTTAGSAFDTVLDGFTASTSPASLTNISLTANNDDFGGTVQSSVTVNVTSGSKYYFRVSSWGYSRGSVTLGWSLAPVCPSATDPIGDYFCKARTVSGTSSTNTVDNTGANFETGEPAPQVGVSEASVWYAWTAPDNGLLDLTASSSISSVLGVFTGPSLVNLTRPSGWTDASGTSISRTLIVSKDVVYYWRLSSLSSNQRGSISLNHTFSPNANATVPSAPASATVSSSLIDGTIDVSWTASPNDGGLPINFYSAYVVETGATCQTDGAGRACSISGLTNYSQYTVSTYALNSLGASAPRAAGTVRPGTANDAFATPFVISGSPTLSGRNTYATSEFGEPAHAGSAASKSMWYSYTPSASGLLSMNTLGSSFDTVLAVYTGGAVTGLTSVASNDDSKSGTWSEVSFAVTAGTTYRIAVDGYLGRTGTYTLSWSLALPQPPSAPTNVRATTSRPRTVEITWAASVTTSFPVIDYTVTASPGGQQCVWASGPLTCSIGGLATGTTYTFSVKARNSVGYSASSAPSNPITPRTLTSVTTNANSWGVDRIDQAALPLDGMFSTTNRGEGTVIFVVDTGIYSAHDEFTGRLASGRNFVSVNGSVDPTATTDCQGHGTHVASTAAGTDYGVATSATIVPVRVLDCSGSGLTSWIVSGLDYIASYPLDGRRAVVNMSLGGSASASLNAAVAKLVNDSNIVVVAAAGNESGLACDNSPAQEPLAITVAATDSSDERAWFSNYGSCVDLFAPGFAITGAAISGPSNTAQKSGTSMAAPHVSGAAAIALAAYPTASATSIATLLVNDSTKNVVTNAGEGSPNRLLLASGSSLPVETTPVTLRTVSPTRLFDTRTGIGGVPVQKVGGDYELEVQVTGRNGVPLIGVSAVSLNVTVTNTSAWGYVTVYPCGERPNSSSLNFVANTTIANAVVAPLSSDGRLCFYSYSPVDLIADVNGSLLDGNGFESVSPSRLFDTRTGEGGVPAFPVGGDYVLEVPVAGRAGVPAAGAGAAVLNVTATDTSGWGYVTVFPCGSLPNASNINFVAGDTVPNAVVAPLSPRGTVCFYVYGSAHLLTDVTGYFSSNVGFTALEPQRLEDTRSFGTFGLVGNDEGTGAPLRATVLGRAGIPTSNVAAVSLNVTAIGTATNVTGYVTVYPCGEPPNASNLNFLIDEVVPNAVIAPVSSSGEICIYVYGRAHILVDVNGYITSTL